MWSYQFWFLTENPWNRSWKSNWYHWYGNISWTLSDDINKESLSQKYKKIHKNKKEKTIEDYKREQYEKQNKEKLKKY